MPKVLTEEDKKIRAQAVEKALANARLEGHVSTREELNEWNAYINGTQSLKVTRQRLQKTLVSDR